MQAIRIGLTGTVQMKVEPRHLASHAGNMGADVLSTHHVVLLMEQAARSAIQDRLPAGKITVGTMIRIRHLAASPLGSKVWARAQLRDVQERRLAFDVAAFDEWGKISEGENVQLIVSLERFLARVRDKQEQIGNGRS